MNGRAKLALALAPAAPLLALAGGSGLVLVLALAIEGALAWLVVTALAPPRSPRAGPVADALAWLLGSGALLGSALLASPFPRWLATPGPGRTAALVLAAVTALAATALVLAPARRGP